MQQRKLEGYFRGCSCLKQKKKGPLMFLVAECLVAVVEAGNAFEVCLGSCEK